MATNEFELHQDRLTTTDEKGRRIFVFPADVRGKFRQWRNISQAILIVIFLILPWIEIQGRQALLLDVIHRRFEIFGLSLRAHNVPLFFFVLAMAGFGLFFVTAVLGRVWCGWACPQTVFIDGIYRRIERWIEGPALKRKALDRGPWNFEKVFKRSMKWFLYLGATLIITHSFLAYFVGTDELARMIQSSPFENWGVFLFMAISTLIVLIDFAWFREQFCTIVCPYGRFQSTLMDRTSLAILYDQTRGEPRATPQSRALAKAHQTKLGDCVNCYRCVQVCPTGIDIRRGVQMECIACTSCIDACDEVMTKMNKPPGLIKYSSLKPKPSTYITWRAGVYLGIVVASALALFVSLSRIAPVDAQVLRAKSTPYTVQENGHPDHLIVTNHFKIELSNQSGEDNSVSFRVSPEGLQSGVEMITAFPERLLKDGEIIHADIFFRFPKPILSQGQAKIKLLITHKATTTNSTSQVEKEVVLVGPF